MSEHAGQIAVYRSIYAYMHSVWLMGVMGDVTEETAHWQPPGRVVPIAGHFAHALISEDVLLSMFVGGRKPLLASAFAGRTGIDKQMPLGKWDEWARLVRVELDAAREYAQAVFAATDEMIAAIPEGDLDRVLDLTSVGMGHMPMRDLVNTLAIHAAPHAGEISAIKGLQDAKGYPF